MCPGLISQPPGMVGKKRLASLIISCGVGWMHHAGRAQITQVRPMPPHNRCFNNTSLKTPRCNAHTASLLVGIAQERDNRQQEERKKE